MLDIDKNEISCYSQKHFCELVSPIYNGLYRYIYCLIRNKTLADDVFQNTLTKAYCNLSELRDESKFKTWIYSIGKHESLDILRKNKKEISVDSRSYDLIPDQYNLPEKIILRKEMKDALIKEINDLDYEDREIIILKYFNFLKLKEIAIILNINNSTIRTRHRRIKSKLYQKLNEAGLL